MTAKMKLATSFSEVDKKPTQADKSFFGKEFTAGEGKIIKTW